MQHHQQPPAAPAPMHPHPHHHHGPIDTHQHRTRWTAGLVGPVPANSQPASSVRDFTRASRYTHPSAAAYRYTHPSAAAALRIPSMMTPPDKERSSGRHQGQRDVESGHGAAVAEAMPTATERESLSRSGGCLGCFIRGVGAGGGNSDPEGDEGPPPTMQGGGPPAVRFFSSAAAEVRIFADSVNLTKKHLGQ